jgi:predicted transcriptional regulator
MTTITVNLPEELHRKLKEQARRNRRSLNQEAIRALERGIQADGGDPTLLEDLLKSHERMKARGVWVTPEMIDEAIDEGRP